MSVILSFSKIFTATYNSMSIYQNTWIGQEFKFGNRIKEAGSYLFSSEYVFAELDFPEGSFSNRRA